MPILMPLSHLLVFVCMLINLVNDDMLSDPLKACGVTVMCKIRPPLLEPL